MNLRWHRSRSDWTEHAVWSFIIICLISQAINPFPNKAWFLRVCSIGLLKTLWENEKLLVTSNFSFSQCFLPFRKTFCHFYQIRSSRSKTLWVWKSQNFVIWERVKIKIFMGLHGFVFLSPVGVSFINVALKELNGPQQMLSVSTGPKNSNWKWLLSNCHARKGSGRHAGTTGKSKCKYCQFGWLVHFTLHHVKQRLKVFRFVCYLFNHNFISMGESNTVVSACTLCRHLQQYCFHPSIWTIQDFCNLNIHKDWIWQKSKSWTLVGDSFSYMK